MDKSIDERGQGARIAREGGRVIHSGALTVGLPRCQPTNSQEDRPGDAMAA